MEVSRFSRPRPRNAYRLSTCQPAVIGSVSLPVAAPTPLPSRRVVESSNLPFAYVVHRPSSNLPIPPLLGTIVDCGLATMHPECCRYEWLGLGQGLEGANIPARRLHLVTQKRCGEAPHGADWHSRDAKSNDASMSHFVSRQTARVHCL